MESVEESLAGLRAKIDAVDGEIRELIASRFGLTNEVVWLKRSTGSELMDAEREAEIRARFEQRFGPTEEGALFGRALARLLLEESRRRQREAVHGAGN